MSGRAWVRPTVLTVTQRRRLEQIAELARTQPKLSAAAAVMGVTVYSLRQLCYVLTGYSGWPAVLEPWLFALPVEAADDEDETDATIRTRLRHWLKSTGTEDKDFAQVCQTGANVVRAFVDGGELHNPALLGRFLNKMRNAPWGYHLGKRRTMPLQHGSHMEPRPFSSEDELRARVEADQTRRDADRRRWLEIEQQKYRLPKRGRLPEEMAA